MRKKIAWPLSVLISLLASSVACLLMPLSMYDSNPSEFPMTAFSEVLLYSCALVIVVAAIVFIFLAALNRWLPKMYLPGIGLVFGLSVALYAQGNLIGANYGVLDGNAIQWDAMRSVAVVNTLIWGLCILVPVIGSLIFGRVAEKCFKLLVPIFLSYVVLLSVMLVCANIPAFGRKKLLGFSLDKLMELSSERNLVVMVLDSFDRAVFDRLLEEDSSWQDRFAGFTYYHNTVSTYCYTVLALPQIVSGYDRHDDGDDVWGFQRKAYGAAPFLKTAQRLGYSVDAYYDQPECPLREEFEQFGFFGNVNKNEPRFLSADNLKHYASLYMCSTFRYLPHLMKRWWYDRLESFKERFCISMFSTKVEDELSKSIKTDVFSLIPVRKVKLYHCASLHVPMFNLEKAREGLEMVCQFIEKTREAGVYDKTDFFIMADHGSINRCRPLFMCSNGTSEFKVSEMPFSYRHLCEAFSDSLNGRPIQPVEAKPSEMVPLVDDPNRAKLERIDEKLLAGVGSEFSGNALELLATTDQMDVGIVDGLARITWTGKESVIGLPVEESLQGKELILTLTFDRKLTEGLRFSVQCPYRDVQDVDCRMDTAADSTDVVINLPDMSEYPDKRFVNLIFHEWKGSTAPYIVKVKLSAVH